MIGRVLDAAVALLLLLGAARIVVGWNRAGVTGQDRTMLAGGALLLVLAAALWFARRLPRGWRWRAYAGLGLMILLAISSFRVTGVTGDLKPIVELRWGGGGARPVLLAKGSTVGTDADFPQFLGPSRDARLPGPDLADDWVTSPPREVWRIPVGEAWSSFAVSGRFAITQEQHGPEERVVAYDWPTGELVWSHSDRTRYETTIGGIGPRATPTIADGAVYAAGATGLVTALDLESGDELWQHDLQARFGPRVVLEWGISASPLVDDGAVIVSVGGGPGAALMAFATTDGRELWSLGDAPASYSSPNILELAGVEQLVMFHRDSVRGYRSDGSEELWSVPWSRQQPNVAQPIRVSDRRLLVSSGYGVGAKLIELSSENGGVGAKVIWESPRLKAKFTNVVEHQGSVYGLDDGVLVCLDPESGERRWKKGRYGHGQLLLVGADLLIATEDGRLVLGAASEDEWVERATMELFDGKLWNPPALFGPYLLLRNDREAILLELPTVE